MLFQPGTSPFSSRLPSLDFALALTSLPSPTIRFLAIHAQSQTSFERSRDQSLQLVKVHIVCPPLKRKAIQPRDGR